MPEEGIVESGEIKIHQSSHARYFEDFLKFVEYGESMPEMVKNQVMEMVYEQIDTIYPEQTEERQKLDQAMEVWAASEKREIQEHH